MIKMQIVIIKCLKVHELSPSYLRVITYLL